MHILILADPIDNQSAGVYTYTKNLIEALLKIDKKNRYTFIHERENDFFKWRNHHIIPDKNRIAYGTYRKFHLIPKLIRKLKPDIVFEPCHIGPLNLPKSIKRVTTIHDLTPLLFPQFHENQSVLIHKLLLPKIIKKADLIITPSNTTKKDILKLNSKARVTTIPLGAKPQKSQISVRTKVPSLLYLGTIEPRKNLEILIEAYNELNLKHKLILAGKIGWKARSILKKASENPNIILTGQITEKEKANLYKNAAIFIYPSHYEGFGLPPLEAMQYGIPVITSNNSSLKEYFKNHALLFKTKNQLKIHIKTLLNKKSLREKLSKNGQQYANQFTWEKTAKETLKAFESLKTLDN